MQQTIKVVFFLLLGIAFVLFAVWSHLSGASTILAVVIGATVTYLGLLSGFAWKDKDAWQRRAVESIVHPIIGSTPRAAAACVVVLIANVAAVWLLLQPESNVVVTINVTFDDESPAWTQLQDEPFTYSITLPNAETEAPAPITTPETSVTFEVPPIGDSKQIVVEVDHRAFDAASETLTLQQAGDNVIIDLVAKPILVVRLNPTPQEIEKYGARVYRVDQNRPSPADFDSTGRLVWIVNLSEDWLVDLVDRDLSRTFRSSVITISQKVKSHLIDVNRIAADDWADADAPRRIGSKTIDRDPGFPGSPGSRIDADLAGRFLYGGLPADVDVLVRTGYVVSYNPELKVPNWVGYKLTSSPDLFDERIGVFRSDPDIPAGQSARVEDYSRSGYHRGHLVSERDMRRFGEQAVVEANLLSAVAPQTQRLNQGVWASVESWAREYVEDTGKWVCVAAGPAFLHHTEEGLETVQRVTTIGEGQVGVPTHFWRVHTRLVDGKPDVMCVLVPNQSDLEKDVTAYLVSLGEIERVANLRFFPELAPEAQPDRTHVPTDLW